jgi:hypothetical protein
MPIGPSPTRLLALLIAVVDGAHMAKIETIINDIYDAWRAQDLDLFASYLPDDFCHIRAFTQRVRQGAVLKWLAH